MGSRTQGALTVVRRAATFGGRLLSNVVGTLLAGAFFAVLYHYWFLSFFIDKRETSRVVSPDGATAAFIARSDPGALGSGVHKVWVVKLDGLPNLPRRVLTITRASYIRIEWRGSDHLWVSASADARAYGDLSDYRPDDIRPRVLTVHLEPFE